MPVNEQTECTVPALKAVEAVIALSDFRLYEEVWRAPIQLLHETLAEARETHLDLLRNVVFSRYTLRPHSPRIQSALASLGAAGIVRVDNPHYEWLEVNQEDREALKRHISDLPDEVIETLRDIARDFDRRAEEFTQSSTQP